MSQPIANNVRFVYSVAEAAKLLSLSPRSLRYLLQTGRLGFVRLGRRVLIRHADLEALLRKAYVRPMQALDADEPIRPRAEGPREAS
jgi:excisionase family DNA binding protein